MKQEISLSGETQEERIAELEAKLKAPLSEELRALLRNRAVELKGAVTYYRDPEPRAVPVDDDPPPWDESL